MAVIDLQTILGILFLVALILGLRQVDKFIKNMQQRSKEKKKKKKKKTNHRK